MYEGNVQNGLLLMISYSRSEVPSWPTRGRQSIVLQSHKNKTSKQKPPPLGLGSCDSDVLNTTNYEHTQQMNFQDFRFIYQEKFFK